MLLLAKPGHVIVSIKSNVCMREISCISVLRSVIVSQTDVEYSTYRTVRTSVRQSVRQSLAHSQSRKSISKEEGELQEDGRLQKGGPPRGIRPALMPAEVLLQRRHQPLQRRERHVHRGRLLGRAAPPVFSPGQHRVYEFLFFLFYAFSSI